MTTGKPPETPAFAGGDRNSHGEVGPSEPWRGVLSDAAPRDHIVQLYQNQRFLNRAVCRFAAAALAHGEGVILVPTAAHWEAVRPRLEAEGVDIKAALAQRTGGEVKPDRQESTMENGFAGLRILVIEDEAVVAMLIEDTLGEMGCAVIGTASWLYDAMNKVCSLAFDAAIVDVNLNGAVAYPVAEALKERSIPFVFATGYGRAGVPDDFDGVPLLQKPFQQRDLERALTAAFASAR